MMQRVVLTLLAGGALLLLLGLILGDSRLLASTQLGYWSSALVVLASFGTYRQMVQRRLEAQSIPTDQADRDSIDLIDDPHDLYSEEEDTELTAREQIRAEKERLKRSRRSFKATARDAVPAFSIRRLGAYGVLVLGFFFLNSTHLLDIASYLAALALPIFLAIWSLVHQERQ